MLGSEAWNNGARYSNTWAARLTYVQNKLDEAAVTAYASLLRGGVDCTLSEKFSAGDFNYVKRISFSDGVSWIARIRMPSIDQFKGVEGIEGETNGDGKGMASEPKVGGRDLLALESEIATMEYILSHTSIPVPKVHGYSLTNSLHGICFPFIFMDYIHGTTAFELSIKHGNPLSIPAAYTTHYYTQLAGIMEELACLRFSSIGSIVHGPGSKDTTTPTYTIGPISETATGPFLSAREFYQSYPKDLATTFYGAKEDGGWKSSGAEQVIEKFPTFTAHAAEESSFGLTNLDLGSNNVLVDSEFNILGVIDWDTAISAPRVVCHHLPWCLGADPGIPGGGMPKVFGTWEGREELTRSFTAIVEQVSKEKAVAAGKSTTAEITPHFTQREFFTKESLSFRAVAFFRARQTWVDEEWIPGYEWMEKCTGQKQILDFYGVQ